MLRALTLLLLSLPTAFAASAAEDAAITLPSGTEVVSRHFYSDKGPLLLWFTGQYGTIEAEQQAAARLAEKGSEVWLTDWLAPYFLPQLPGSIPLVPDTDLGDWLVSIHQRNPGRQMILVASGHTADLALRAAKTARERMKTAPTGSILLFPLLYRGLEAGADPDYVPVVNETSMKLSVLIPKLSAGFWWRDRLKERLEAAGSFVKLTVLPGMRDGFYRRTDATENEVAAGAELGNTIWQAITNLLQEKSP